MSLLLILNILLLKDRRFKCTQSLKSAFSRLHKQRDAFFLRDAHHDHRRVLLLRVRRAARGGRKVQRDHVDSAERVSR